MAEERLSNLQKAWRDPGSWETDCREHEENLRSAQEMNQFLPFVKDGQRSQSSHENTVIPQEFAPYSGSSLNAFGSHFASDGATAGQGRPAPVPTWDLRSENTTGSNTPDLLDSTNRPSPASASSMDSTVALPQKRPRDSPIKSLDHSKPVMKARRTTPSPSMSGANTPSSYATSEYTEGIPEDLYGLFGGDPNEAARELATSKREQKEHMKAVEEKWKQELADAAFARSLQEELNGPTSPTAALTVGPSSSAFNQSYLTTAGQVHRPAQASSSSMKSEPLFAGGPTSSKSHSSYQPLSSTHVQRESSHQARPNNTGIKKELSQPPNRFNSPIISSDDFITLDSDDDDTVVQNLIASTRPSSDLLEFDAQSWRQSNRHTVPGSFPFESPTNPYAQGSTEAFGRRNPIVSMAQGCAGSVYNALGQAVSIIGDTTGLSGTHVYGSTPSYSHNGVPIVDLEDDDDYERNNVYQRSMIRAGFNPRDVELRNRYRERYDYITHDPTRTLKEMKELLENIRPDEDLPPENREGTPAAMVYNLMEHQKLGVAWMRRMEEGTNRGGSKSFSMSFACSVTLMICCSPGR